MEELSNMVRLLAKVVPRCKDEHSRLSVESDFLVYCDTGEHFPDGQGMEGHEARRKAKSQPL